MREYLEATQKVALKTFGAAIRSKRLSHAYILVGEEGTPLKETALFLAKSILCDHPDPLADEECLTCKRIDANNYPDLYVRDGSSDSLKKEAIMDLVAGFQKTPLEKKGILVYVINRVEGMTVSAENALLKFLEEPSDNTYAILTTANVTRVLPTILSRAEAIRLVLPNRQAVEKEAIDLGVDPKDAFLLSPFSGSGRQILETSKEDDYEGAKAAYMALLEESKKEHPHYAALGTNRLLALINRSLPSLRLFFNLLEWGSRYHLYQKLGEDLPVMAYDVYQGLDSGLDPVYVLGLLPGLRQSAEAGVYVNLILDELSYQLEYGKHSVQ